MDSADSAPCFSVGMIFFGGNDDREALAFAKRMANNSKISLTVINLVAQSNLETMVVVLLLLVKKWLILKR